MCVYVTCIFVCVCACAYFYLHVFVRKCLSVCISVFLYVCVCVCKVRKGSGRACGHAHWVPTHAWHRGGARMSTAGVCVRTCARVCGCDSGLSPSGDIC